MENVQTQATEKQVNFIKKLDASFTAFDGLTIKEASKLIGRLLKAQKTGTTVSQEARSKTETASKNIVKSIKFYYNGIKYQGSKLEKMSYYVNSNYDIVIYENSDYHSNRSKNRSALLEALKVNIKNDTDVYADYFCDDSYIITPDNENYLQVLNAIASLCEQLKDKKSYYYNTWDKIEQLALLLNNSNNYINTINELIEKDNQKEYEKQISINKRTIEEAKEKKLSSNGCCVLESDSRYIYLYARKCNIIDFSSSFGKLVLDIHITVFDKKYERLYQFFFENNIPDIKELTREENSLIFEALKTL